MNQMMSKDMEMIISNFEETNGATFGDEMEEIPESTKLSEWG